MSWLESELTRRELLKIGAAGAGVLSLGPLLAACGSKSPSTTGASTGTGQNAGASGTLIVGVLDLPPNVDVETADHPMIWVFLRELTDTMLRYKSVPSTTTPGLMVMDYSSFEPRLAESYAVSPDGKTVTFHLKKGIKSAWGNELTADDVYFKWWRGLKMQGSTAFYASVMAIPDISAIKVVDRYTVSFTSTVPNPQVVSMMALSCCTFPYDSVQAKKMSGGDPLATAYIDKNSPSFGPYYVTDWTAGKQAVLTANPNYFMGAPKIQKVIFQVVPESSSQFALLEAGSIDVAHDLLPNDILRLKGVSGVKTVVTQGHWLTHLQLNEKMVPQFANKLVRQAVNYAIDRDKIIKTAYLGMAQPMTCVYPSDFPGALGPSSFPYNYNIAQAKQLMAQAGYSNGFSVDLYYQADIDTLQSACLIIQEGLAQIGIKVSLRSTPLGTLETLYTDKKAPFALIRLYPFQPDANYDVGLMYATKGFCNYGYFSNAKIDNMIAQGVSIVDQSKRNAWHQKIQELILEEAPVGFVVQDGYTVAMRDDIQGWNLDIAETTRFDDLTKA